MPRIHQFIVLVLMISLFGCGSGLTREQEQQQKWLGRSMDEFLMETGYEPKGTRQLSGGMTLYYFEEHFKDDHTDYTGSCQPNLMKGVYDDNNSGNNNVNVNVEVNEAVNCRYTTDEYCRWQITKAPDQTIINFTIRDDSTFCGRGRVFR